MECEIRIKITITIRKMIKSAIKSKSRRRVRVVTRQGLGVKTALVAGMFWRPQSATAFRTGRRDWPLGVRE